MSWVENFREVAAFASENKILTGFIATAFGGVTIAGQKLFSKALDHFLTDDLLTSRGLKKAYNNAASIIEDLKPLKAIRKAYERNHELNHIFLEIAQLAVVSERGKPTIILDFTKTEENPKHGIIYTASKEMFGNNSPSEIYEFISTAYNMSLNQMKTHFEWDDATFKRLKEHAIMNCSWSRQSKHDRQARNDISQAFRGLLKELSQPTPKNNETSIPPSNISRKGTYAFRWTSNHDAVKDGAQISAAILIKPRTDTEKQIHTEMFGTARSNFDKDMNPVDGNQALDNYKLVKAEKTKRDMKAAAKNTVIAQMLFR